MVDILNFVLIMGRPGSGKSSQARLLAQKLDWERFSTGDRLKELRGGEGALNELVRVVYDSGRFHPDWLATYLLEEKLLALPLTSGFVCEGYGRTKAQAELLDEMLSWLGRPYRVIDIIVTEEETLRRQMERGKTENRPDSNTEALVRLRFSDFQEKTEPAIAYFKERGVLTTIDGEKSMEQVAREVSAALGIA